jgi:hypothetical protein
MADTSDVQIAVVAEVTPGVTPATPAFKNIRVTSESLTPAFDTLVSAEIRSDATVSDVRRTGITVSGDIGFELHRDGQAGGFDDLLAASIRGAWTTNVAKGGTLKPSFTLERRINGASGYSYLRFQGTRIGGISLSLTPDEMITGTLHATGTAHTAAAALITGATYANASTNSPMAGIDVTSLAVGGVSGVDYTGLTIDVDLNTRVQRKLGQVAARGIGFGRRVTTGTLTCFFEDLTAYNLFMNNTSQSIVATASDGTNQFTFTIPRARFTSGEVPTPGNDADFILTLGWQATYDSTLGTDIQFARV